MLLVDVEEDLGLPLLEEEVETENHVGLKKKVEDPSLARKEHAKLVECCHPIQLKQ